MQPRYPNTRDVDPNADRQTRLYDVADISSADGENFEEISNSVEIHMYIDIAARADHKFSSTGLYNVVNIAERDSRASSIALIFSRCN